MLNLCVNPKKEEKTNQVPVSMRFLRVQRYATSVRCCRGYAASLFQKKEEDSSAGSTAALPTALAPAQGLCSAVKGQLFE